MAHGAENLRIACRMEGEDKFLTGRDFMSKMARFGFVLRANLNHFT